MAVLVVVLALVSLGASSAGTSAGRTAAEPSSVVKKCKFVIKKVHGKKKRVRVCTKPKPRPKIKNVSLILDRARSVSLPLTVANGGTVTATARSGARLTLRVPRNALREDATIKLTPVAAIKGLPVGAKLLGAVQLEPEGLALDGPATLTIEGSKIRSAKTVRGIGWHAMGRTASFYPVARAGRQIRLQIWHFSGYGGLDEVTLDDLIDLRDSQRTFYEQSVRPKMLRATADDSERVIHDAIEAWLGWERTFELIGDPDFMAAERQAMVNLHPRITHNGIDKAYERCRDEHYISSEMRTLLGWKRSADLMAGGTFLGHAFTGEALREAQSLPALAEDRLNKCATFELDFETVLTTSGGSTLEIHIRARRVKLPGFLPFYGQGTLPAIQPLEVLSVTYTNAGGCNVYIVPGSVAATEPFEVHKFEYTAWFRLEAGKPPPPTPEITIGIKPGGVRFTLRSEGGEECYGEYTYTGFVQQLFYTLHQDEYDPAYDGYAIRNWTFLGGSLWARKTYARTTQGITERTTLDLRHAPE